MNRSDTGRRADEVAAAQAAAAAAARANARALPLTERVAHLLEERREPVERPDAGRRERRFERR